MSSTAPVLVDDVLAATGGGRVLVTGEAVDDVVAAFRKRAVDAQGLVLERSALLRLPFAGASFDLVYADLALDGLDREKRRCAIRELLRVTRRSVLLRSTEGKRAAIEREWLAEACRKHPLHQVVVPYNGIDWRPDTLLLFERLPASATAGRELDGLASSRDLHADMLREAGRRADAHVARYMLARQYIRPGDRVLDAACGLGYGSAILTEGTLASSVLGIDIDPATIAYANEHYGGRGSRLTFDVRDVMSAAILAPHSLDAVVSFETLEHIREPEAFLAACKRALAPSGRLICSVPNEWIDEHGVDPNPHHLQVFNRARLERMSRQHFAIEHVFGQTAGGGMKHAEADRRIWTASDTETQAEWWLLVGMNTETTAPGPVRIGLVDGAVEDGTNVLAFDRDYTNPWLARLLVTIGLRTESDSLLADMAERTLAASDAASPDAGAALCVQAYRHFENGAPLPRGLQTQITSYTLATTTVPHARRWQVSLLFVDACSRLQRGDIAGASASLEACASADALGFSPLLATKTVAAAFTRGWIALQTRDIDEARRWWTLGVQQAERALHRPWSDMLLNPESPALFGLREAALVVDLASQCASGLGLSAHALDRPGLVASQLFWSLKERLDRALANPQQSTAGNAGPGAFRWSLLEHLNETTLEKGTPERMAKWDAVIDGEFAATLMLHPPAVLNATIPTGAAGRLTTAVAIHPDAWGRPNAGACAFSIRADGAIAATVVMNPHALDADRRWVDVRLDLRESSTGTHTITLETEAVQQPDFAWALFRDAVFRT